MFEQRLKGLTILFQGLGPKGTAIVIGSIIAIIAAITYSIVRSNREHGRRRTALYFGIGIAVAAVVDWLHFHNPNMAPTLLEWLGRDMILKISVALGVVGLLIARLELVGSVLGKPELADKLGLTRTLCGAISVIPMLCAWFLWDGVANWKELPTEKGNYQLSKLTEEKQNFIVSHYKNLESAFKEKDYARTIQESNQILAIMPDGYHFAAEYRIDSQNKMAAQASVVPDPNRVPSQITSAATSEVMQPAMDKATTPPSSAPPAAVTPTQ